MGLKSKLIRIKSVIVKEITDLIITLITLFIILSVTALITALWYFTGFLVGVVLVYFGVPPIVAGLDTRILTGIILVIVRIVRVALI